MFSKNIFDLAVTCVESAIGIPYDAFMSARKSRYVDARSILVRILKDYGMSEQELSTYMSISQQGVNKLYNNHNLRMRFSPMVRRCYESAYNDFTTTLQRIHNSYN
jgi:hypothetical protein